MAGLDPAIHVPQCRPVDARDKPGHDGTNGLENAMKVGFIGLGMMGKGMAANLQKAGHQLVVHDIRRAAAEPYLANGATWADSPKAVGEQSEVVFTSLPVPADVEAVALGPNGLIEGMKPDTAFFDMSTNSVSVVRKINAAFAEKNIYMLDSPVSGGPGGAASGKMAIWVGGDEQQFNRLAGVLGAMGDQAAYIGPIGAGTIAKLVHNCTSAVMNVALAEVFTMGIKAGVPPLELWEAVRQGATGRPRTFDRLGKFLAGQYDPADFALRLLHKDVSLAVGLGKEVGVPMRLANLALEELTEAMTRGWGQRDSRVGMLLQVERSGIEQPKVDIDRVNAIIAGDEKK
jgi:3-hydroxyisobutyrate dehydrogenase